MFVYCACLYARKAAIDAETLFIGLSLHELNSIILLAASNRGLPRVSLKGHHVMTKLSVKSLSTLSSLGEGGDREVARDLRGHLQVALTYESGAFASFQFGSSHARARTSVTLSVSECRETLRQRARAGRLLRRFEIASSKRALFATCPTLMSLRD